MQAHLRNTSASILPNKQFYINAKEKNQLAHPNDIAKFVIWLMLETDNTTFCGQNWHK